VRTSACGVGAFGYSFADIATANLIDARLKRVVMGGNCLNISELWSSMVRAIRNLGRPGICSMAISAVDNALWDLKGRLLQLSVADLLGRAHDSIAAYGSGGFTSYSDDELRQQLGGWVEEGITDVKMKIGTHPEADVERVRSARDAIGPRAGLFVDANGAYDRKEALAKAAAFADLGVSWFEEPVSSDDLEGLRLIREHAPPGIRIAAGEYGYDSYYFRRMLAAGAVDVLQADATRCAGITGFLAAGNLSAAFATPFSAHHPHHVRSADGRGNRKLSFLYGRRINARGQVRRVALRRARRWAIEGRVPAENVRRRNLRGLSRIQNRLGSTGQDESRKDR